MGRLLALLYGAACYLLGFVTVLYAIGFVGNLVVPKSIDSGGQGSLGETLLINVVLLGIFAIQHSVMARPIFKRWWTRVVPPPVERSTYVLLTSLALILLFWQWRPMTGVAWNVESAGGRHVLWALFWIGWLTVFVSSFLINHLDLFGLRQVYLHMKGQEYSNLPFTKPLLYRLVRHPMMLGFVVAFWAAPYMTLGHIVFSVATTAYILVALQLEEGDLVTHLGAEYREYQQQVPMILPIPKRK